MLEAALILSRQLATMALYMGLGVILIRTKVFTEESKRHFTTFVLYVVSPLLSLSCFNFEYSTDALKRFLLCMLISLVFHLACIPVSFIAKIGSEPKILPSERFSVIFGNTGFIGIPLCLGLLGTVGGFYCVAINVTFNVLIWSYGHALLGKVKGERTLKNYLRLFHHPFFYLTGLGLVMYLLHLSFPAVVQDAVDSIGNMTSPLAMVACGMYLASYNAFRGFKHIRNYFICALKLVVIPLLTLAVLRLVPMDRTMALTVLITASAPMAAVSIFFSDGSDERLERSMETFLMSVLLSIVTLPAIVGFASTVL